MKRNSLVVLIITSIIFALVISSCQTKIENKCQLYRNELTNEVNCYRENQEPTNWSPYQKPEIGIPYACFEENGECELAQ